MGNFVKKNPYICNEILNNHIASNTIEHNRTIVRMTQTMGIFDEDEDSDAFLDHEDIVDTPTFNRIVEATSLQDNDMATSSTTSSNVQINKVSTFTLHDTITKQIIPSLSTSQSDIRPVNIQSIDDVIMKRLAYDADLYEGSVDAMMIHENVTKGQCDEIEDISQLHLDNINCFIDSLRKTKQTEVKQFTNMDLKNHINQHWRVKIKVQMDSGASDCITPDKHLLKQFRHVKPRSLNTADVTSTEWRIEGEGLMDIQTATGD